MNKLFGAVALSVIGCMSMGSISAYAAPAAAPVMAAQQETITYKIIRNGQPAGICTVSNVAELDAVVARMGSGTYVFIGIGDGSASADRRIIVYQTSSLAGGTAAATADRRIIVY